MTTKQLDAITDFLLAADDFAHAFMQDYPDITAKVDAAADEVVNWAQTLGFVID